MESTKEFDFKEYLKSVGGLASTIAGCVCGLAAEWGTILTARHIITGCYKAVKLAKGKTPHMLTLGVLSLGAGAIGWWIGDKVGDFVEEKLTSSTEVLANVIDGVSKAVDAHEAKQGAESNAKQAVKATKPQPVPYMPMSETVARYVLEKEGVQANGHTADARGVKVAGLPGADQSGRRGNGGGGEGARKGAPKKQGGGKKGQRRRSGNKRH